MPELPEVETTRRGLEPHLVDRRIHGVILRRPDLLKSLLIVELDQLLPLVLQNLGLLFLFLKLHCDLEVL